MDHAALILLLYFLRYIKVFEKQTEMFCFFDYDFCLPAPEIAIFGSLITLLKSRVRPNIVTT